MNTSLLVAVALGVPAVLVGGLLFGARFGGVLGERAGLWLTFGVLCAFAEGLVAFVLWYRGEQWSGVAAGAALWLLFAFLPKQARE